MTEYLEGLYPFVFFGAMIVLAVAELFVPRRTPSTLLNRRWFTNIGLFFVGVSLQRVFLPVSAIAFAEMAQRSGLGLINLADWNGWIPIALGVLVLDFWKYVEHRLLHTVPVFWRLHLTHHTDTDTDFTTTERHHPLEIFFGVSSVFAAIFVFGIPPEAVAVFLIVASGLAFFSHANVRVSERVEHALNSVIVSPGFHNVHHSAARVETDSNFGEILTLWDRVFATYRYPSLEKEAARVIGLENFQDARSARIDRVLYQPFLPLTVSASPDGDRPSQTAGV